MRKLRLELSAVAATILLVGGVTSAHAQRSATATITPTPDTLRADAVRESHEVKRLAEQQIVQALEADPNYAPLQAELLAASEIDDEATQNLALQDIAVRAQAMRSNAIRRSGVNVAAVSSGAILARKPAESTATPAPASSSPTTSVKVTSFTEVDTRKIDCPDAGDTWSFSGNQSRFDVSSGPAPGDNDCGWIRAAKGAFIDVPAGTKHVALTVKLDYALKLTTASFAVWAEAWGEVGVRVENMNGTPIDVMKLPGVAPIPTNISFCWVKPVSTAQGPNFVPWSDSGDQGTNTTVNCSFNVDPKGGRMMVAPYVGGGVDADLSGYAVSRGTVNPRSVEAVFTQ